MTKLIILIIGLLLLAGCSQPVQKQAQQTIRYEEREECLQWKNIDLPSGLKTDDEESFRTLCTDGRTIAGLPEGSGQAQQCIKKRKHCYLIIDNNECSVTWDEINRTGKYDCHEEHEIGCAPSRQ